MEAAHRAVIKNYPSEFRGNMTERFVLSEIGMDSSTPLPVQANYMKSMWAGTAAMLFFALTLFSIDQSFGGWLGMIFFLIVAASTVKSWMTYQKNLRQKSISGDQEST
jgi:hypothetical protein